MAEKITVEVEMNNGAEPSYFYFDGVLDAEQTMREELKKFHKSEVKSIHVYVTEETIIKYRLGILNMYGKFIAI